MEDIIVQYLDIIRFITGVLILFYASYTDIKTRKASNINWLLMGGIGGILLLVQYLTVGFDNIMYLLFIPIMIGLVYVLFQLRLILVELMQRHLWLLQYLHQLNQISHKFQYGKVL